MMEEGSMRIRLIFEEGGILSNIQKKDGLKRSWVLLKPHLHTISDVVSYLLHSFHLYDSCPNGIILTMDGFVLPPFESTTMLKDKDIICVKRKKAKLEDVTQAIEGAKISIEDDVVEKQPLSSGIKLLTNKEHDEETGGHLNDTNEDEAETEEIILPQENVSGKEVASKKRKASSKIERLKTKRQRQLTPGGVQKKHAHSCEHTSHKKSKLRHRNKGDPISKPEVNVESTKNPEPTSDSENEPSESKERSAPMAKVCDGAKKVSRGTRRKRLQRMWKKIYKSKENMDKCEGKLPVKDLNADSESKKSMTANILECQQANEESDAEGDLVPVMIRPGHIKFTPSGKVKDVQQNQATNGWDALPTDIDVQECYSAKRNAWNAQDNNVAKDSFQWNGITNKRKGQKWGKQKQPAASWKDSRDHHVSSNLQQFEWNRTDKWEGQKWGKDKWTTSSWKESRDCDKKSSGAGTSYATVDFEKLVPLTDLPKAGDVVAYRLLELSSSWCPELSSFRIGKVSNFEPASNKIMLVPDPEFPLNIEKKVNNDDADEDGCGLPPASLYDEDGSLETDFQSLVDVRIVKRGDLIQPDGAAEPAANGTATPPKTSNRVDGTQDGNLKTASDVNNGELWTSTPVNGKKDVWEEISEALSVKKAQLSQEDNWKKKENSAKRTWSQRNLRSSALGPTMAMLRAQNGL